MIQFLLKFSEYSLKELKKGSKTVLAVLLIGWTGVPEMVLFSDAQEISCEKGSLKSANLRGICLPWGKIR